MEASFGDSEDDYNVERLKTKCKLLLQGHNIARCINQHLNLVVSLHVSSKKAMSKSTLIYVARMVCALGALKIGVFRRQVGFILFSHVVCRDHGSGYPGCGFS